MTRDALDIQLAGERAECADAIRAVIAPDAMWHCYCCGNSAQRPVVFSRAQLLSAAEQHWLKANSSRRRSTLSSSTWCLAVFDLLDAGVLAETVSLRLTVATELSTGRSAT